ncbi:MAG TPA: ester cyclase [Gemmatimonadaceae bacterium]|nr:ester cyclase [Gemmatimonadaceae bacterium]
MPESGMGQAHLDIFRRLIEEGFSRGDVGVVDEVCAEEFIEHQHGIEPANREGLKRAIGFLHRLSPDIKVTIEDVTVSGDKLWARLRGRGTHGGDIQGGPTGRSFEITIMDCCRFRAGKIVEHWGVADRLAQMQQLGLMPPRPPASPPS